MSDTRLTDLTALTIPATGDILYIVDVSDLTDAASGSSRRITLTNLTGGGVPVGETSTNTLTNKTINLASNTLTGTLAEFNTALSDANFASLTGAETLTNKTLTAPTISGTVAGGAIYTSPVLTTPQINDTSADHQYVFAVSELVADRTVTLPLLTGADEFVFKDHTQTLTNKRTTKRVDTVTSSATPTINTDNVDMFTITALALAITSMTTNLSGTPTNGQTLIIRFLDNGTARAITWGVSFASRGATLPTTTTLSKYTYVGLIWNSTASIWDCIAVVTEV